MRRGSHRISIDVEPATGKVVNAAGECAAADLRDGSAAQGRAVGTLALPEIRDQAADVARRILADDA